MTIPRQRRISNGLVADWLIRRERIENAAGPDNLSLVGGVGFVDGGLTNFNIGYAYVPSTPSSLKFASGSADFTLEAWVDLNTTSTNHPILDVRDANDDGYRLWVLSSSLGYIARASLNARDFDSSSVVAGQGLTHLVAVFDRDGNGQMYVNGSADGSPTALGSEAMSITSDLHIGKEAWRISSNVASGSVYIARIYNRTLNPVEIQMLYKAGRF